MRGLIALCVGLVLVQGAVSAAQAGQAATTCCICNCTQRGRVACSQGSDDALKFCSQTCATYGENPINHACNSNTECSTVVPTCPTSEAGFCSDLADNDDNGLTDSEDPACNPAAPTASPYGIAALLIALGGFGAWRLRKRATA